MQAVRQFHKVTNGSITIQLPVDFPTDEVEVIILPKLTTVNENGDEQDELQQALQSFLNIDTSQFTPEQLQAYHRTCMLLYKGRKPDEPRMFGLFAGLIEMSEDFNELPEEYVDLFYADNLFAQTTDEIVPSR